MVVSLQHVEGDEDGRRAKHCGIGFAEELKARDELLIEHGDFAIEDERVWPQLRNRRGDVGELNVQHLDSVSDVVAKITGVVVRETVPDSVLELADELELVDLSAENLRRRLKDGKVYIAEAAAEASEKFFREGNLIALRELALRHTAERVLVCIGPSPLSARLVRAGRRLAAQLEAPWVVAYVETPAARKLSADDRARSQTLRLAESLGAETVTLTGTRMSDELLAYARSRNVSKLVIGKPTRGFWQRAFLGSIVDALVRGSGESTST